MRVAVRHLESRNMIVACVKRLRAAIYVPVGADLQRKGDNFTVLQLSFLYIS